MVCRNCLNELESGWNYCPICGLDQQKAGKRFVEVYEEWEEKYQSKICHSTLNCYRAAKKYYEDLLKLPTLKTVIEP